MFVLFPQNVLPTDFWFVLEAAGDPGQAARPSTSGVRRWNSVSIQSGACTGVLRTGQRKPEQADAENSR